MLRKNSARVLAMHAQLETTCGIDLGPEHSILPFTLARCSYGA